MFIDIRQWTEVRSSQGSLVDAKQLEQIVQKRMYWFGIAFLLCLVPVYVLLFWRYNNRPFAWAVLAFIFACAGFSVLVVSWRRSYRVGLLWLHGGMFLGFLAGAVEKLSVNTGVFWWLTVIPFVALLSGLTVLGILQGGVVVVYAAMAFATQAPAAGAGFGESLRLHVAVGLSTVYACAYLALATLWRRRLQSALEEARVAAMAAADAKARFLANMSHEIRTPLAGIIGAAELLQSSSTSEAQRAQLLALQAQSADALLALINDVLDWAKLDAKKLALEDEPFDLRALVFEANELFAVNAFNKGVELTSSCNPDVPRRFRGDATRIRQVVNNLVGNAVKFTSRGSVHIHLALEGVDPRDALAPDARRWIRIEVSDSGIGILPDQLRALFKAFAQADSSINRKYGGTGLGLAISNELATLMGGRLEATSTVGEGSTFTLRIPLQLDQALVVPRIPRQRRDVMLITRNPGLVRHMKSLLHELGYDPDTRHDIPAIPHELDDKRLVLVDAPLLSMLSNPAAWLSDLGRRRLEVVVMTPLNSDAVVGALPQGRILYKPVRKDALALVLGEQAEAQVAMASMAAAEHQYSPRVLLCEDNSVNQVIVQAMLSELGASSTVAANGYEALECLGSDRFDLVLMDMHMPELDGLQATRKWRAFEATRGEHVPIVAMTANLQGEDGPACQEAGMDDFLAKPFNLAALERVLMRHVPRGAEPSQNG